MGAGRKQAIRQRELGARRKAMRAAFKARNPQSYRSAPPARKPVNPVMRALMILFAVAAMLLIAAFLLHNQIEIARVMTGGRPTQATITTVNCERSSRSSTGYVKVAFTDLRGQRHIIAHTTDTFGCYDNYAVGDIITIHYVPDDPAALLTEQEIDDAPLALVIYALADCVFLIAPVVIAGWLAWKRGIPWGRRRWAAWRANVTQ